MTERRSEKPGEIVSVPAPRSAFLPLPFAVRWNHQNKVAMREGNWHVHSAPSQYGKSTANRAFYLDQRARKASDGLTIVPVAQCWATQSKLILRTLAESLGGERFAAQPNREQLVPRAIKSLETRLIIVNNGHNMDWRQWQELLDLDDICWAQHGVRPAVVFSGVHRELGLLKLPKSQELVAQIRKRICCYIEIPGHDRAEVRVALHLLLERDCPELLERDILTLSPLVHKILIEPVFDRWGTKTAATVDLVELCRRLAAVYRADPKSSIELILERAATAYRKAQTQPDEDPAAGITRLQAALAA